MHRTQPITIGLNFQDVHLLRWSYWQTATTNIKELELPLSTIVFWCFSITFSLSIARL